MSTHIQVAADGMVFRSTHIGTGRNISVDPGNSTMRHLAYGRIILNASRPAVTFSNDDRETGLICLSG